MAPTFFKDKSFVKVPSGLSGTELKLKFYDVKEEFT